MKSNSTKTVCNEHGNPRTQNDHFLESQNQQTIRYLVVTHS